jgi:hypothetical protein
MRYSAITAIALATLAAAGCDKNEGEAAKTASSAVVLSDDDVPVPEDYIEEVTKEVTKDNYKAELEKIEKEIAGN